METSSQRERRRALIAVLCVLLIALSGFVEAAHFHPSKRVSERSCPVCVVAQHNNAVSTSAAHAATQTFVVISRVAPARMEAHSYLDDSAFFIRPPPLV